MLKSNSLSRAGDEMYKYSGTGQKPLNIQSSRILGCVGKVWSKEEEDT